MPCTSATISVEKEGFKFHQIVAVVTGGGKARTISLCEQCYNARRLRNVERQVTASKWRQNGCAEGSSTQAVDSILAWSNSCAKMWNLSLLNKRGPDQFWWGVEKKRQNDTDGDW